MPLNKISIHGYRGFREIGVLDLAVPNGDNGSGLTILTGPNNSGKSCILECLRARSGNRSVSFTAGTRNAQIEEVEIKYTVEDKIEYVRSISKGSSETQKTNIHEKLSIFVLPSRRTFSPYFGKGEWSRAQYLGNAILPSQRSSTLSNFEYRLFNTLKEPEHFNSLLAEVLGFKPIWTIDQSDQGSYFLKFFNGNNSHSSDGMGEGIISVFAIVDSLYDSAPGDIIAIDEPELSLHPALQKRLSQLLERFAKDRQIVIATHSPYFVNLKVLANGAHLARVSTFDAATRIFQLSNSSKEAIHKLSEGNLYNPHTFGLDARELFFQEDCVILTEGQEDVLLFPTVAEQVNSSIPGQFFGWGAGGADNIAYLCRILKDLGFKKVAGIMDSDKYRNVENLNNEFPEYFFACIPAKDIRTKSARTATNKVIGLMDNERIVRPEFHEQLRSLFANLSRAFSA